MIWLVGLILITGIGVVVYSFASEDKPEKEKRESINQVAKPRGVKVISVLYFLVSLLALGFGALAFLGSIFSNQIQGVGLFGKFFAIGGIIFIAFSILGISIGIGLWKYRNWARWIAIFFSLIGIIGAIISISKGKIASNIFDVAVYSIIGGYLFFNPAVKAAFDSKKGFVPLNKKLLWLSIISVLLVVGLAAILGVHTTATTTPTPTLSATLPTTASTLTPTSEGETQVSSPK